MKRIIRIYRYARQHVEDAEKLLEELTEVRNDLDVSIERVADIYTSALTNGDMYVPISFMRRDNDFNRHRVRMEDKQSRVVMNLAFALSFCAELVSLMTCENDKDALTFKVRVRDVIERVISVATDDAMNGASLAPLVPAIAKMESDIVFYDAEYLGLIKRNLLEFRARMS